MFVVRLINCLCRLWANLFARCTSALADTQKATTIPDLVKHTRDRESSAAKNKSNLFKKQAVATELQLCFPKMYTRQTMSMLPSSGDDQQGILRLIVKAKNKSNLFKKQAVATELRAMFLERYTRQTMSMLPSSGDDQQGILRLIVKATDSDDV